jgi:hypothetical protein
MVVGNPYKFTLAVWHRYFKQFWPYLQQNHLDRDLYQEFYLVSLEITGMEMQMAGRLVQKEFRGFLKSIGFRKMDGDYMLRELLYNPDWWDYFYLTGRVFDRN